MRESQYNFVVFGSNDEFYKAAYYDIMNLENVRYIGSSLQSKNKLINCLYRLHTSPKTNEHFKLPFKRIYNRFYFKNNFENSLPICFLFFGYSRGKILEWGYYKYLKKKYPNSKLVCFFQDLISTNVNLNLDRFRQYFDLLLSFDHGDAKKHDLTYYPLVYSKECPFELSDTYPKSNVFFVGKAKDRLAEIISAYKKLNDSGLICDFHIIDAKRDYKPYAEQIYYCSFMPYEEYLGRLIASSCVLELMQHGGHGFTLRTYEAIVYGKKLLSNNPELLSAPFYNPSYISVFKEPDDIDISFIKAKTEIVNYCYSNQISPLALLEFVEKKLSNEGKL